MLYKVLQKRRYKLYFLFLKLPGTVFFNYIEQVQIGKKAKHIDISICFTTTNTMNN